MRLPGYNLPAGYNPRSRVGNDWTENDPFKVGQQCMVVFDCVSCIMSQGTVCMRPTIWQGACVDQTLGSQGWCIACCRAMARGVRQQAELNAKALVAVGCLVTVHVQSLNRVHTLCGLLRQMPSSLKSGGKVCETPMSGASVI